MVLGIIIIGPGIIFILYDMGLYLYRSVMHEIPLVGGRARGQPRPRGLSTEGRLGSAGKISGDVSRGDGERLRGRAQERESTLVEDEGRGEEEIGRGKRG